jgi:hypothetical protein
MTQHGRHHTSPRKKKPKQCLQPVRPWEESFEMLQDDTVKFLSQGETINAADYLQTLHKLRMCTALQMSLEEKDHPATQCMSLALFCVYMERIQKNSWELLPDTPYSPAIGPSYCHLFQFINDWREGEHYLTKETVQKAM